MNKHVHKLTASALAISLAAIGCTPSVQSQRPIALSAAASPKLEKDSARLYAQAQEAVAAGDMTKALSLAERTVELSPRDVGYRMLLADLYLKNGRFASAETSFSDVTALDPGNVRATLSMALAMIAQGKTVMATAELDKLQATAAPGDLGLAFALAGEHGRALELLEAAAREQNASARVRQNLALAYAFSGDWQKARIVAAQDLSGAELPARLAHWATLAKPADSYAQVAALLGVTPVEDPGQPVRLALAPAEPNPVQFAEAEAQPAPVVLAQAEPAPAPPAPAQPAPVAPVPVQPAPVPTTGFYAKIAAVVRSAPAEIEVIVPPAPAPAPAAVPAPVVAPAPIVVTPVKPADLPVRLAAATEQLVSADGTVMRKAPAIAPAPIPRFKPAKITNIETKPSNVGQGRFVVQIGAYRHVVQAERAWGEAQRRYGLGAKHPVSTTVTLPGRGTFHRLAVASFEAPDQAARLCGTIRARGGSCFVRTVAGDAPLQFAARNARRG
jgi:Flp pilus assembly protein TadD